MTTKDKIAWRKLSLLTLAKELENVSRARKVMGYSRQQFYEIRRNFQTYGAEGLIDRLPGPKGPHPNRVPAEIESTILDHALAHPCHGALRRVRQCWRKKSLTELRNSKKLPQMKKNAARDRSGLGRYRFGARTEAGPV